jgi:hypothetical protein
MGEALSNLGRKALAALVLVVAAYLLFKLVVGALTAVAWIAVAVVAMIAVVWALRTL